MKFHRGERLVQQRLGLHDAAASLAERAIRTHMPDPHRDMLERLPFLIAAGRDPQQRIWASLLPGAPGFVHTPSDRHLHIASQALPGDALEQGFARHSDIGLLGIDLATRRRNRINGSIIDNSDGGIAVEVRQCYGNCPQYIRPRQWQATELAHNTRQLFRDQVLTTHTTNWIRGADTFFIASGFSRHGRDAYGLDASHRGGNAGFVKVLNEKQLQFPDYAGNNFFNTLGNIVVNPQVGLLFVDFLNGSLLQLSGHARIDWVAAGTEACEAEQRGAALRTITVDIEEIVASLHTLPLHWQLL